MKIVQLYIIIINIYIAFLFEVTHSADYICVYIERERERERERDYAAVIIVVCDTQSSIRSSRRNGFLLLIVVIRL